MGDLARKRSMQNRVKANVELPTGTLVIGNLTRWNTEGRIPAPIDTVQFTELGMLTRELLDAQIPDIILSPLVGDDFDALDVSARLDDLGYQGRYRAITQVLPSADMIRKEVRALAPNLDFDILMMPTIANDV